jgi:cytochrome d ubiquinol oxidase subunit II
MENLTAYLPDIWLQLIGFFLLYYAVTDGADLGVGIWSLLSRRPQERQAMMASVSSIWHGNQTWLVILGGMLFGAFPKFYAVLLSALYIPIIIMLFGLILRGVSFEFHERSERKTFWCHIFGAGSLIVTLAQGFALGGLLGGLKVVEGRFIGSVWDWISLYGVFVATGVVAGYMMLGANYLVARTSGALQKKSYRLAVYSSLVTLLVSAGVHLWTMVRYPVMAHKWTATARLPLLLLSLGTITAFILYFRALAQRRHLAPFLLNAAIIIFSFAGLSIGLYPNMIPGVVSAFTVYEAAASSKTLFFMLVSTAVLLPVILSYTAYNYWVFRGKTDEGSYGAGGE